MTLQKSDLDALSRAAEVADAQRELVKLATSNGFSRRRWSAVATLLGAVTVMMLFVVAGGEHPVQSPGQLDATIDTIPSAPFG